jgi:hypothetical protein
MKTGARIGILLPGSLVGETRIRISARDSRTRQQLWTSSPKRNGNSVGPIHSHRDVHMRFYSRVGNEARPEAEFLDGIGTKVYRIFLLAIHSHLVDFTTPPPLLSKSGLKSVCNVNKLQV